MSFIRRIAARATPARNLLIPKGFVRRTAQLDKEEELPAQTLRRQEQEEEQPLQTLRRQEQEEEETMQTLRRQVGEEQEEVEHAQPLRRQSEEEEEEELQTLRRQAEEDQEEEELAQSLRRQSEEEEEEAVQTLRRQAEEEEEAAQPLRRQEQDVEEEESLQTLRRQAEEEEPVQALRRQSEEEEEMQTLRRTAANPESPDVDQAPFPEETRGEEEPPAVTALYREVPATVNNGTHDFTPGDPGMTEPDIGIHAGVNDMDNTGDGFNRPSVQIDQLDVLIHEPAQPGGASRPVDRSRSIRTRYLRRL